MTQEANASITTDEPPGVDLLVASLAFEHEFARRLGQSRAPSLLDNTVWQS